MLAGLGPVYKQQQQQAKKYQAEQQDMEKQKGKILVDIGRVVEAFALGLANLVDEAANGSEGWTSRFFNAVRAAGCVRVDLMVRKEAITTTSTSAIASNTCAKNTTTGEKRPRHFSLSAFPSPSMSSAMISWQERLQQQISVDLSCEKGGGFVLWVPRRVLHEPTEDMVKVVEREVRGVFALGEGDESLNSDKDKNIGGEAGAVAAATGVQGQSLRYAPAEEERVQDGGDYYDGNHDGHDDYDYDHDHRDLPCPEELFARGPQYMIVRDQEGEVVIEGSHSPSLELLARWFRKWCCRINTKEDDSGDGGFLKVCMT